MQPLKQLTLPLLAGALFFTACGDKSETPSESASAAKEVEIPDTPDAAIQHVLHALADGNGVVIWEAMPASYQSDLTAIAQLAGNKIDAEIYDKIFTTLGRVSIVFDKQKDFVFNTDLMGEKADAEQIAQMREAWPSVMNLVKTITTSSISTVSGLQSFEGQAFFSDTVSGVLSDMDALAKLQPERDDPLMSDYKDAKVKYIEGTDSEATLAMSIPGEEAATEAFVKVEERWVPKAMADEWATQMAETRTKLEAIDAEQVAKQKPQILSVFAMIDGVLTQIESAETQEQFDQALQGAMMPIMGLMMMGQGMGGAAPGMQSAPAMPVMPPMPIAPGAPSAP